ncbi:MAG: IS200/IS605 family transposase [Pseudanabaena sp. CAN_BIN31]|nr:IS200/IS605 family transposase [Pseudanabaena sp. CAN_BIN31]
MAFWRTYYHLIWSTAARQPLITPDIEPELYGYIIGKSDAMGCIVHSINGIEDHIHIVASIPPKIAISDFVKQIKGSSAYHMNHLPSSLDLAFGWQQSYGVFTLGSKQLETAKNYVDNQKKHHSEGTTIKLLETDDS